MTGRSLRRRTAAISASSGVIPARPSTTNKMRSASSIATITWARTPATRSDVGWGSKPPVSTTAACHRSKATVPYRRSRVTPGTSRTRDLRWPTSRLKRVDFPTLGRPTMAMIGRTVDLLLCGPASVAHERPEERRGRGLHGDHGRAQRGREVRGREVVQEHPGSVPHGHGGNQDGIAEVAPGELGLDVVTGEKAGHSDAAAEPIVGDGG